MVQDYRRKCIGTAFKFIELLHDHLVVSTLKKSINSSDNIPGVIKVARWSWTL